MFSGGYKGNIGKKRVSPHMHKMWTQALKHYNFGESSASIYFSIFMLENMIIIILTELERIYKKLWIFLQLFSSSPGPIIGTKFTISCEFDSLQVKLWYQIFSSMKIEKYTESDLSVIFRVKWVAKNITFGSQRSQGWSVFAVTCLFLKNKCSEPDF